MRGEGELSENGNGVSGGGETYASRRFKAELALRAVVLLLRASVLVSAMKDERRKRNERMRSSTFNFPPRPSPTRHSFQAYGWPTGTAECSR